MSSKLRNILRQTFYKPSKSKKHKATDFASDAVKVADELEKQLERSVQEIYKNAK